MKHITKTMLIVALMGAFLTGCTDQKDSQSKCDDCHIFNTQKLGLKVAAPAGAPAVSLFAHLDEKNVEINAANAVQAYLTDSSDKDIVILPTNYGIKQIVSAGVNFQIAATVTFGNFFLLSTGLDDDGVLNENDKVMAFQQNGVGGKIFQYVYGDLNLDVTYVGDVSEVKDAIFEVNGNAFNYDYALLAQPVVNAVLSKKSNYKIYANIQEKYQTKSGGKEITQASIFVKKSANKEKVVEVLNILKEDIAQLLDDTSFIVEETNGLDNEFVTGKLSGTAEVIKKLLDDGNQLGIGYKDAYGNKASIDAFIQTLGMAETSEEIYFRA